MDGVLRIITDWEVNIVFFLSVLFPAVTRLYWPWNKSVWGWNIILLELSIAGAMFPSVVFIDFGITSKFLEWSGAFSIALVALVILWRAVIIWRTQRKGSEEDQSS